MKETETREEEARRLRDIVYGAPCSDKSWSYCKDYWMYDLEWLRAEAAKVEKERKNE